MKKLLILIGSLSIVACLYLLFKGESFQSVIAILVCGIVLLGSGLINTEDNNCEINH